MFPMMTAGVASWRPSSGLLWRSAGGEESEDGHDDLSMMTDESTSTVGGKRKIRRNAGDEISKT
jgi:hypothetical protein